MDGKEAHVYSIPLVINKSTGVKFGKSEDGAVWLDPTKTSVYKFYQFWLNTDDIGVIDYLKIYSLMSKEEIETIAARHAENPSAREAQKALAVAVTDIVHGTTRRESVERVTSVLFGGLSFNDLNDNDIEALTSEIPTVSTGKSVVEALVESGLALSNGEAKRLIESGSVSVNGEKLASDAVLESRCLVKKGKNSFVLVK
jgi:tyrosyl-tRNA synthetase